MTLPANWQDGQSFSAAAEDAVENAINSLMVCVPTAAATLSLSANNASYVHTGTGATWTLPSVAGSANKLLRLYNRGTGPVTVRCAGSDKISNTGTLVSSVALPPNGSYELLNDGTYWLSLRSATPLPSYDNSAAAPYQGALASGTAVTWTHNVGSGSPYGIVCLTSMSSTMTIPAITSATVTFGGVTLNAVGAYPLGAEWIWIFGGSGIPPGTQTVSVTLTQSSKSFVGFVSSYTYFNVASPGIFSATAVSNPFGNFSILRLSGLRTGSSPTRLFANGALSNGITYTSATQRQLVTGGGAETFGGDVAIFGPERFSYINVPNSNKLDVFATLELLGTLPSGPYLQAVGGAAIGVTGNYSWPHTAQAGANVFVAFGSGANTTASSVTYGGTPMTLIGSVWNNNDSSGSSGITSLYRLSNVSPGTKSVAVSVVGSATWTAQSVSFMQVSSVGTAAYSYGAGTALSQGPITCTSNQVILQCFGSDQGGFVETDPGSSVITNITGSGSGVIINQAPATNTFTGTVTSGPWGGIAVVLS